MNYTGQLGIGKLVEIHVGLPTITDYTNGTLSGSGKPIYGSDDPKQIQTYFLDANNKAGWQPDSGQQPKEFGQKHSNVIFVDAAAGSDHSLLVDSTGTVWVAGANDRGQLGLPLASETDGVSYLDVFVRLDTLSSGANSVPNATLLLSLIHI